MSVLPLHRRRLLQLSGLGAGAAALAACSTDGSGGDKGNANGRPPAPTTFPQEWPIPKAVPADSYGYDNSPDKVTFSLMTVGAFNGPRPKDPIKDYLDKQFNADITFSSMTADDMRSKLPLAFSGGDAPDFVNVAGMRDLAAMLYDQGQVLAVDDILGMMPQASMYITEKYKQWATVDDAMIGIPVYPVFPDIWNLYIRQDFMKFEGLELPKTTDDLYTFAEALQGKDPTPGKQGPWFMATGGGGTSWSMFGQVMAAFGHPTFNVKDGKINHPMIDGTTKAFLEFVNKLRSANLLPPDWYTTQWEALKSRTFNDQLGMVQYPGTNLAGETFTATKSMTKVKAWAPVGQVSSPNNPDGLLPPGSGPGGLFLFNAKLKDDETKLRRIAHMIDTFMYPNVNYWNVAQGGGPAIWGDAVQVKFDEATGRNSFTIPPTAPYQKDQSLASLADWQFFGYTLVWQNIDATEQDKIGQGWNNEVLKLKRWENFEMLLNLDAKVVADLKTLADRSEIKFALGQRSFDEWDAYVDEWRKGGGDQLLKQAADQLKVQPA